MRLAHLVVVTPKRCGLYETTRDLVMALRRKGIDSRMVDPTFEKNSLHPKVHEDRGAPLCQDMEWVKSANYLVNHSGTGKEIAKFGVPLIQVAHGRPVSSFKLEEQGSTPIYTYYYDQNNNPMVKAMVTFWPEHVPYWQVLFSHKPVFLIPAMVDASDWSMEGPTEYGFKGNKGKINVVLTDPCRLDLDPYEAINAFALWARKRVGAKLHIYGKQYNGEKAWTTLLRTINNDGNLGEMGGWVNRGLDNLYRAADFMLTSNPIATRSMREAMACGCPVVVVRDIINDQQKMTEALNADRAEVRRQAEITFNPEHSSKAFISMLQTIQANVRAA